MDACTGQHAFREGEGQAVRFGGRGRWGATSEYGLTVFVDGPSTRFNPSLSAWWCAEARKLGGDFDRLDQVAFDVYLRIIPSRSR